MSALKEYRENAARAIFITGVIDDPLVQKLTPDICRLRGESIEPITVYINSPGGSTLCADQLRALLATPNQDGHVCRIITVATSRADSAAADLLALGDYAIAYATTVIHCHGSRLAEQEITSEFAAVLAASLKQSNDDFALRLARRTFARVVFQFANLRGGFAAIRQQTADAQSERTVPTFVECYALAISDRLSNEFKNLPQRVILKYKRLAEILKYVVSQPDRLDVTEPMVKREAEILKRLIEYELAHRDLSTWRLGKNGIDDVSQGYKDVSDYISGPHRNALKDHLDSLGVLFLEPAEVPEYSSRQSVNPKQAREWLRERTERLIGEMWYFVVSLCRLLQQGEYGLTATDAYWLGIVDEVVGANLPSFRLIAESSANNPS